MELIQGIKERRSIRRFRAEKVTAEDLKKIVEAAAFAPSWKNTQIARYNVIGNKEIIEKIANEGVLGFEYNTKTMSHAPQLVVVSYVNGRSGYERDGSFTTPKGQEWQMFDAGIAAQTFCLAAHAYGVGSCIMGIFDDKIVGGLIGLPKGENVAAVIAIGYPDETPEAPKRKGVDQLLRIVE